MNMWPASETLIELTNAERDQANDMYFEAAMRSDGADSGSKRHDIKSDMVALNHIATGFFDHYPAQRWRRLELAYGG